MKHLRKELLSSISDSTDTNNLENARPDKEDFGMACVDTVMELRILYQNER